jgi:hypothetical protein
VATIASESSHKHIACAGTTTSSTIRYVCRRRADQEHASICIYICQMESCKASCVSCKRIQRHGSATHHLAPPNDGIPRRAIRCNDQNLLAGLQFTQVCCLLGRGLNVSMHWARINSKRPAVDVATLSTLHGRLVPSMAIRSTSTCMQVRKCI